MRIIGYIPHDQCKITVFKSDNRFSIKIENRLFEETYKLRASQSIEGLKDIEKIVDETLIQRTLQRFVNMQQDIDAAQKRNLPEAEEDEFEEII